MRRRFRSRTFPYEILGIFFYKPAYDKERRENLAKVQGVGTKIKAKWIMEPMLRRHMQCVCLPLILVPIFTNGVCDAQ